MLTHMLKFAEAEPEVCVNKNALIKEWLKHSRLLL